MPFIKKGANGIIGVTFKQLERGIGLTRDERRNRLCGNGLGERSEGNMVVRVCSDSSNAQIYKS